MQTIDTVKLKMSNESIQDYDKYKFFESKSFDPQAECYISNKLYAMDIYKNNGVKSICLDKLSGNVFLEMSAKVLNKEYFELININTIEKVFENVNSKAIQFNINKAIDSAKVLKCDVTNNLKVNKDITEYINALSQLKYNYNYDVNEYKNESIIFRGNKKTVKDRLIFYDKFKELQTFKNKEFIRDFTIQDLNKFKNILRVETNLTKHRQMRKIFNTKELKLVDILKSEKKVNFNMFSKVKEKEITLFNEHKEMSLQQIENRKGTEYIIKQLGYNMKLIRKFIRERIKGNIYSRYIPKYKQVLNEMLVEQKGYKQECILIKEIESLLQVA